MPNTPNKKNLTKTFGNSGTYLFNGNITGEEYSRVLQGRTGIEKFDIMRKSDPTVRAILRVVKLPILAATFGIDAASDEDQDVEAKEFVERELFKRNVIFTDFLSEATTMFDFGFCVFEKTFGPTEFNGKPMIGLAELGSRKQRSIMYWQQEDGTPGIQQTTASGSFSIPQEKLLIFTNEQEGQNYAGVSLLRAAFKPWDIKDKLDIMNAIALERQAVGIPVLSETGDNQPADVEKAEESLRQMYANEEAFIKLPKNLELTLLDMKAQTTKDVIPTIQYLDRQISKSVLAQFLELGGGKSGGSRALSSDQTSLFMKAEYAAAHYMMAVIQQNLIKQLCDLNFTELPNGYPKITITGIEDEDTAGMASSISQLMSVNALTPDAALEDHLRAIMKLTPLPDDIRDNYADRTLNTPAPGGTAPTAPKVNENDPTDPNEELPNSTQQNAAVKILRQTNNKLIKAVMAELDE